MIIIRGIIQKVIRSIELKGVKGENRIPYIEDEEMKYMHTINDSELLRIIQAVDAKAKVPKDEKKLGKKLYQYMDALISVNIGYNTPRYEKIKEQDGIIILEHKKWAENKLISVLNDNEQVVEERFKRLIVGSGQCRGKKAWFVREDLFDKVHKILLGGIDELKEINGFSCV